MVLGLALVFEGGAWWVAFREFRRSKGPLGYFAAVRASKDPTIFTVLFEDSAAMLGLLVAFLGVALSDYLQMPMLDGVASIVIGCILGLTAVLLAYESKGLLIGEAASPALVAGVKSIVQNKQGVERVNELLTMHMGPQDVLVNLSLDFHDSLNSAGVERTISELEEEIKGAYPEVTRIFIEAQSWRGHERAQQP